MEFGEKAGVFESMQEHERNKYADTQIHRYR